MTDDVWWVISGTELRGMLDEAALSDPEWVYIQHYIGTADEEEEASMTLDDPDEYDDILDRDYGPWYYDRQGLPITMEGWTTLHADRDYCIIGRTHIGLVMVSTVWLGLDHGYRYLPGHEDDPPIIFETMIFEGDHDGYQERYATEKEALTGHERAVALVRSTPPPRAA